MTGSRASLTLLIAISLIWGSSWIANSVLSGMAGPLHLAVLRYGAAFVVLAVAFGFSALFGSRRPKSSGNPDHLAGESPDDGGSVPRFAILHALDTPSSKRFRWYGRSLLLGCTMFALPELLLLAAAEHGAAAFIPLVYAALPLGLSIVAGVLRLPAVLAVGAMLVLLNGSLSLSAPKLGWALLIVVAVALQGWSLLYARARLADVATVRGCMAQAIGAFWLLYIALQLRPEGTSTLALHAWPAASLATLCVLGGLGIAVAYPLYYRLLAHLEPSQLAVSTWLQTVVAVAESAVILRQHPPWPMLGAAVVLLACTAALLRVGLPRASELRFLPGQQP